LTDIPAEIIFTRNTTESLNLVAHALGSRIKAGDEIVLTAMEHHSNIVPWQLLADRCGAKVRFAGLTPDGHIDIDQMRELINPVTRIVALAHASNVLGTINPVAEVSAMARRHGAFVVVDAAQSVPHLPVDVPSLGCDFFAFSAHKMLGPTGVGVLWAPAELLDSLPPFLGGGDMISVVKESGSTWADLPHKFEAGTPNIADVIAFGAAIDYLNAIGMSEIREHEMELTGYALDRLRTIEEVDIHGPLDPEQRSGLVSFTLGDIHPHDVSEVLDYQGIAIRAGHHCAQPLMRRLGVPATNRASFAGGVVTQHDRF
jgi:cysteine desulfurase/selenocysteine lyase